MPRDRDLRVFTGNANPMLARAICSSLDIKLTRGSVSRFSDGEIRVDIDESVRGDDVYIVQPTCAPVNENLMELLIATDAFRRASAGRITAVVPYFGYSRQDKKIKPREPITAKLVSTLITAAGAQRLLTLDLHALQIQGFFDFPVDHLPAGPIIADYLIARGFCGHEVAVVSPDVGGVAMARAYADRLDANVAIIVKRRPQPNQVEVFEVIGEVAGKVCVIVDDIVDTAGSLTMGARALCDRGARAVYACATHPVLSGDALQRIAESPVRSLVVTDTVPLAPERRGARVQVLSVAPSLAEAIRCIHQDQSVSTLFRKNWKTS
ncbi:MAG: ribose-phosphate pyrophosphokinase [Armatimonadetes bacterium]|nr:ribose-phosphate pyrophosphokinase [Armatimonadota bacterium]